MCCFVPRGREGERNKEKLAKVSVNARTGHKE
jgi:hypothetical protein